MTDSIAIDDDIILVWNKFPTSIRNDPCLSVFREEFEGAHAETFTAQNELLKPQIVGETKDSADRTGQSKFSIAKQIAFALIWAFVAWHLLTVKEKNLPKRDIVLNSNQTKSFNYLYDDFGSKISVNLIGPFAKPTNSMTSDSIFIHSQIGDSVREIRRFDIKRTDNDWIKLDTVGFDIDLHSNGTTHAQMLNLSLEITSNANDGVAFQMFVDSHSLDITMGAICGGCILILLNVLIISEIIHRTLAALLVAFASIGTLAAFEDRPTMNEIIEWIDYETLLLIFSMMIVVAILIDTGIFDYIAVYTFQLSHGRIWRLIGILCIISASVSVFLDNVTTILLFTPIVVRLFECLNLNPVPVLPFIILNINIAGLATLIGHPPNLLITGDHYIAQKNITFLTFTMHQCIGVLLAIIQTMCHLRIQHNEIEKLLAPTTKSNAELKMWQNCMDSLKSTIENDKLKALKMIFLEKIESMQVVTETNVPFSRSEHCEKSYETTLRQLKKLYPIKDKPLLQKAGAILIFIITLFFIESIPSIQRLSLGWCAFTGVILLLLISDCNLDAVLLRIEWITLIFFGAMFITMECLARLGLVKWIGRTTEQFIYLVDEDLRLPLAIVVILWVSALTSSIMDSIPVTAVMVKVVVALAQNTTLNLPVQPMAYALAFGPTLGGNASLYGASSNIVCAGVAEKLGHKITFMQYFKVGFPVMLGNVLLVTVYLLVFHVVLDWD